MTYEPSSVPSAPIVSPCSVSLGLRLLAPPALYIRHDDGGGGNLSASRVSVFLPASLHGLFKNIDGFEGLAASESLFFSTKHFRPRLVATQTRSPPDVDAKCHSISFRRPTMREFPCYPHGFSSLQHDDETTKFPAAMTAPRLVLALLSFERQRARTWVL